MKTLLYTIAFCLLILTVVFSYFKINKTAAAFGGASNNQQGYPMTLKQQEGVADIYLAGGCFWGVQAYLDKIAGVVSSQVGYANGNTQNPSYQEVSHNNTGHAEAVHIQYNPQVLPLAKLLSIYFEIINPTILNRQGNDIGTQYRTGVYYTDAVQKESAQKVFKNESKKYKSPIVVELMPIANFYPAETYHQKYLTTNPGGYCHIDLKGADKYKQASPAGCAKNRKRA